MVEACLYQNAEYFLAYQCKGHATENVSLGEKKKAIVLCAGLSAIEQQLFYALQQAFSDELTVNFERHRGFFSLSITSSQLQALNPSQQIQLRTLAASFAIGLKMLASSNQEFFSLDIEKWEFQLEKLDKVLKKVI